MLTEERRCLEEYADTYIPGWRKLSRNELCNKYISIEGPTGGKFECGDNPIKCAYLGAITTMYWNSIKRAYSKLSKIASLQECYDLVVDAIAWALKEHKWTDPSSALYNDPNGPDKCINVDVSSGIMGRFQFSNTHKRKVNGSVSSMEGLYEEYGDAVFNEVHSDMDGSNYMIDKLVSENFKKQNYVASFAIDGVAYYDGLKFEKGDDGYVYSQFSEKLLSKHLRQLDDQYVKDFSKRYNISIDKVQFAVDTCKSLSRARMQTLVNKTFENLKYTTYAEV